MKHFVLMMLFTLASCLSALGATENLTDNRSDKTEKRNYWVLGSYESELNAEQRQSELTRILQQDVGLVRTDNGFHRLVVPVSEVSETALNSIGVTPWTITLPATSSTSAPQQSGFLVLEEPSAIREPSADREPSASKEREPSAEPSATKEREPSAEPSADKEPSASKKREPSAEPSANREPSAEPSATKEREPSASKKKEPQKSYYTVTGFCRDNDELDVCSEARVSAIQENESDLAVRRDALRTYCSAPDLPPMLSEICERLIP